MMTLYITEQTENFLIECYNLCNNNEERTLADEPGISELMQLYMDDMYDYSTGDFKGMSDKTKKQFDEDLKRFYTIFTGNKDMPPEIKTFSDIKLIDHHKKEYCNDSSSSSSTNMEISPNDKLFDEYGKNIQSMVLFVNQTQKKLLEIINNIFVYVIDPVTHKKQTRVSPSLTDDKLKILLEQTRQIITELYLTCEDNYQKGIDIYEAIIESKLLQTTQNQIQTLNNQSQQIIKEQNQNQNQNQNNLPSGL
jgi:hypothetical protein